ncbi:MAG: hypothetical protein HQL56_07825 [Magnetococcales bacterium]|nr:hypothetical protein [Magnetococcales bacterium]
MPENFRDAAQRHLGDATQLFIGNRLPNADHLFGISAECALKAIMQGLHMSQPGLPPKVHMFKLWSAHNKLVNHYQPQLNAPANMFNNWSVEDRYLASTDQKFIHATVASHQKAANDIMNVLTQALLDGVVK